MIRKIGRYYHIEENGRSLGRRRTLSKAFKLLLSLTFKPIDKYSGALTGEIGSIQGFRVPGCIHRAQRLNHEA